MQVSGRITDIFFKGKKKKKKVLNEFDFNRHAAAQFLMFILDIYNGSLHHTFFDIYIFFICFLCFSILYRISVFICLKFTFWLLSVSFVCVRVYTCFFFFFFFFAFSH